MHVLKEDGARRSSATLVFHDSCMQMIYLDLWCLQQQRGLYRHALGSAAYGIDQFKSMMLDLSKELLEIALAMPEDCFLPAPDLSGCPCRACLGQVRTQDPMVFEPMPQPKPPSTQARRFKHPRCEGCAKSINPARKIGLCCSACKKTRCSGCLGLANCRSIFIAYQKAPETWKCPNCHNRDHSPVRSGRSAPPAGTPVGPTKQ